MKKSALFLFFLLLAANVFPQTAKWDNLKTDNGEFSMMLPAGGYSHFHDRNGITVRKTNGGDRYHLKEMRLISCFSDQTLMNVEIYETEQPRKSAEALKANLKINGKLSPGKNFDGVEQTVKNENFVLIRRIIAGKKHVYIITAATRGEPNETMKTFLESLKFVSAADGTHSTDSTEKAVFISSLKNFAPELIDETGVEKKSDVPLIPAKETEDNPTLKKIIILSIPNPSFTDAARKNKIGGNVRLRLNCGANGKINQIRVMQSLPDGLLREAVIAALRIKFLPEEQSGQQRSSSQSVEYHFKTY